MKTQNKAKGIAIPSKMSIWAHFHELRRRLIQVFSLWAICFAGAYYYAETLLAVLVAPLRDMFVAEGISGRLIYTEMTEGFTTALGLACWVAVLCVTPFSLLQLWLFVVPGLYDNEKKLLRILLMMVPVMFVVGVLFAFYGVIPLAWKFFAHFQNWGEVLSLPLTLEPKISSYVALVMKLMVVFGVCFQLPIILIALVWAGWVKIEQLRQWRRYAIVGIFIVAAIITPPDVFSQLALAIPMVILYEASIYIARWVEKFS